MFVCCFDKYQGASLPSQYPNSRDLTFRQVNEIVILLMKAKKSVIVIDISCQEGGNWALC